MKKNVCMWVSYINMLMSSKFQFLSKLSLEHLWSSDLNIKLPTWCCPLNCSGHFPPDMSKFLICCLKPAPPPYFPLLASDISILSIILDSFLPNTQLDNKSFHSIFKYIQNLTHFHTCHPCPGPSRCLLPRFGSSLLITLPACVPPLTVHSQHSTWGDPANL